jgi:hypothetical protein
MLLTFAVELLLAVYVFGRYSATRFGKVAGLILVLLATFQFAEYRICTTEEPTSWLWPRLAFLAITLLPVAGLYLVSLVSRKPHFLKLGYVTAAAFLLYLAFVPKSISHAVCGGNYIVFNTYRFRFFRNRAGSWFVYGRGHDIKQSQGWYEVRD